jgi:chorismate synthase
VSWSIFGENLRITTFGESHGPAVGVVIDGVPPGLPVDREQIAREMEFRKPGGTKVLGSGRSEPDELEFLSGLFQGRTTGHPIAILIRNRDSCPEDYEALRRVFRPGHSDLTWRQKYGVHDHRGGGRSSGRETAARVAAGALAKQILEKDGIRILAWVQAVGGVEARGFDEGFIFQNPLRCPDPASLGAMTDRIDEARARGDSVGGVVSIRCTGVPPGWGDPVFAKLSARLAGALMSIGAVKGVEVGDGFRLAAMTGSESNDPIGEGRKLLSNRCGGILGGISTGDPILLRMAVKPTPSIAMPQKTCDIDGKPVDLTISGRHDPCIAPRAAAVAEAMAALVLADAQLMHGKTK